MLKIKNVLKTIYKCDGKNIFIFNFKKKLDITDHVIICTGNSKIHIKYIYKEIYKNFKKYIINKNIELDKLFEWVILDLNEVIIHIMQKETRFLYKLEELLKNK